MSHLITFYLKSEQLTS